MLSPRHPTKARYASCSATQPRATTKSSAATWTKGNGVWTKRTGSSSYISKAD